VIPRGLPRGNSLEVPSEQKEQQEKKPLWYIDDSFKKIIVTKDILNVRRDEYGIMTINLFDFLLNPNSLDL
jgi:predicted AAA+ superfamily ATPase